MFFHLTVADICVAYNPEYLCANHHLGMQQKGSSLLGEFRA